MLTLRSPPCAAARATPPRPRTTARATPNAVGAPRRPRARPARPPAALPQQATATAASPAAFTSAASGEWEGATATFSRDGTPVELPPRYVPEAFREWGVAVCDWQTQCSTQATVEGEGGKGGGASVRVSYRLKRLLPSVGCEADATAFVDEGVALEVGGGSGGVFSDDGSFVAAAPSLPPTPADPPARVEVALPWPAPACRAAPDGTVPPRRLRAVLTLAADPLAAADAPPPSSSTPPPSVILTAVELFSEKRYADFSNGSDSLAGCGGGVGPFSGSARLEVAALEGPAWAPAAGSTTTADPARGTAGGQGGARLLLPLGAWAAVRRAAGGGLVAEAGFVMESGAGVVRRAGSVAYDGAGRLVDARLSDETAGGGQL